MKRLVVSLILGAVLVICGCGGGSSMNSVSSSANGTSLTINTGDAPNDKIIEFELTINSITLNGGSNPSVRNTATRVEFVHEAGAFEPLVLTNVPTGTYTGATINVSNPELVLVDPVTKTVTKLEGANVVLTSSTVNVTFSPSLVISSSAAVLNLDLNLANSVTISASGTSATITPQFTASASTVAAGQNENEDDGEVDDLHGKVTAVNAPKFTIQSPQMSQPVTIATDANTQFSDGITSLSQIMAGMIVSVDAVTQSDGTLLAKRVESETETANGDEVEGIITAVTCATTSGCPGAGNPATQITLTTQKTASTAPSPSTPATGSSVNVPISSSTKFAVRAGKLSGPFPAFDDTHIGKAQRVEADSENEGGDDSSHVSGDKIRLREQALTGTVSAFSGNQFTLTVDSTSAFATLAGTTTVTVQTSSQTEDKNVTPANGASVRVRGLLFVNGSTYTMLAVRITQPD